jgi:hypothetical protein
MATLDEFLPTAKAASVLELHPQTIKRLCRLGKLNGQKLNGGWVISKTELDSFASTYLETRGRATERVEHRNWDAL